MKLAVIVDDAAAAANVGGAVDRRVRIFDMPKDVSEWIASVRKNNNYIVVSLAEVIEPA